MSGVLTMGSLDPAFAAATSVDGGPVVVDLRTVEFVEPAGLCALGALLEYLCARCEVVDLALAGRDVPAYLERMNFFRSFGERVRTNADVASLEERRRHNPGTLQELINFHTEEEIPGIIERISEILENQGYRLRERVAICSTLSEVCANAAEHGVSSFGAYAAVQAYHIVSGSADAAKRSSSRSPTAASACARRSLVIPPTPNIPPPITMPCATPSRWASRRPVRSAAEEDSPSSQGSPPAPAAPSLCARDQAA